MLKKYLCILSLAILALNTQASELRIEAYKAPFHVGKTVMACGVLKEISSGSRQVYLNLDNTYPNQTLTLLIWNTDISAFNQRFGNLNQYLNKKLCARGTIKPYKNTLQINVINPQFLRVME